MGISGQNGSQQSILVVRGKQMDRVVRLGDLFNCMSSYPDGVDSCSQYRSLGCLDQIQLITGRHHIVECGVKREEKKKQTQ